MIGRIHGDELTAVSIVFRWMEILGKAETDAKQAARNYYWRVIPVLNPNGLLAKSPTRVNARGVDLNRNFPTTNWHQEAPQYWGKKPNATHGLLDFDGPAKGVTAPTQFGRLYSNRVGIYPGFLGNFSSVNDSIPVVTLELPHALKMLTKVELTAVWNDMQRWLKQNLVKPQLAATNP